MLSNYTDDNNLFSMGKIKDLKPFFPNTLRS